MVEVPAPDTVVKAEVDDKGASCGFSERGVVGELVDLTRVGEEDLVSVDEIVGTTVGVEVEGRMSGEIAGDARGLDSESGTELEIGEAPKLNPTEGGGIFATGAADPKPNVGALVVVGVVPNPKFVLSGVVLLVGVTPNPNVGVVAAGVLNGFPVFAAPNRGGGTTVEVGLAVAAVMAAPKIDKAGFVTATSSGAIGFEVEVEVEVAPKFILPKFNPVPLPVVLDFPAATISALLLALLMAAPISNPVIVGSKSGGSSTLLPSSSSPSSSFISSSASSESLEFPRAFVLKARFDPRVGKEVEEEEIPKEVGEEEPKGDPKLDAGGGGANPFEPKAVGEVVEAVLAKGDVEVKVVLKGLIEGLVIVAVVVVG